MYMRTMHARDIFKSPVQNHYPYLVTANSLCRSRKLSLLDSGVDLLIGTFVEGKKGASNRSVLQDPSGDESMLECDGALHVTSSVVDGGGDGKQSVVDFSSLFVVLCLSSLEELKQSLGSNTSVTDKHTVDVESGVEEVFVVAGHGVDVGSLTSDDGDLSVPSSHVSDTVLHGKDTGLSEDVELSLEIVGSLGGVGVLEEDEGQTGCLVDRFVSSLRGSLLVAESKPPVGRVEKTGSSTGLLGSLGLETGNVVTLSSDTGNYGDSVVGRLDKGLDHLDLLVLSEEGTFTGVTENDETLDALERAEPRSDSLNGIVVDRAVFVERGDGSRSDSRHVEADSTSRVGKVRG